MAMNRQRALGRADRDLRTQADTPAAAEIRRQLRRYEAQPIDRSGQHGFGAPPRPTTPPPTHGGNVVGSYQYAPPPPRGNVPEGYVHPGQLPSWRRGAPTRPLPRPEPPREDIYGMRDRLIRHYQERIRTLQSNLSQQTRMRRGRVRELQAQINEFRAHEKQYSFRIETEIQVLRSKIQRLRSRYLDADDVRDLTRREFGSAA